MKKLFLLLTFVIGLITLQAQTNVYHSFPEGNAMWNVSAQGCCWTDCPGPPNPNPMVADYNFSYTIAGDTLINTTVYHKLYKTGTVHEHCSFGNFTDNRYTINEYAGAYRQDVNLKKVYFVQPDGSESLLYDFNLNVGDTLRNWENCGLVILSIDSIQIDNNYRKRFNLSPSSQYSIIEGIGGTSGLLEPLCPFEYIGNLVCFSQDEQTLFPDAETKCEQITSIRKLKSVLNVLEIYPNPADEEINFSREVRQLKIYNAIGQELMNITQVKSISTAELPEGIYTVQTESSFHKIVVKH